jgi:hypothetical protein
MIGLFLLHVYNHSQSYNVLLLTIFFGALIQRGQNAKLSNSAIFCYTTSTSAAYGQIFDQVIWSLKGIADRK